MSDYKQIIRGKIQAPDMTYTDELYKAMLAALQAYRQHSQKLNAKAVQAIELRDFKPTRTRKPLADNPALDVTGLQRHRLSSSLWAA